MTTSDAGWGGALFRRGVIVLLALLVAGCASIPLSTMLRLSQLDQQTLVQLDPAQIRVRVAVPAGFEINVAETRLSLDLDASAAGHNKSSFDLSTLRESGGTRSGGLFRSDIEVKVYDLALTRDAITRFRKTQQFALANEISEVNFSVTSKMASMPEDARSIRFWIDLRLRQADSYMTLIDGAEVEFEFEQPQG